MAEGSPSGDARTTGSPNIGAIRSGPSFPRDPEAPSLLTTLPAELRLEIYEILFLRDKPVLIKPRPSWFHNTRFLDPSEVCPDVSSEEFEYDGWSEVSSVAQDDEDSSPSSKNLSRTSSGIDSAFGLLGSCRQIYTEAIATLYSKNTFLLSLTRSEFLTRRIDITVQWMLTLGSTISLLRHVHIRACKFDYDENVSLCSIDIARLARFMWQNPTKELHISFGPHPKVLKDSLAAVSRCEYSERMNNALTPIVKDDSLDIKRYKKTKKLVSGIFIDDYVRSGRIYYPYHTDTGDRYQGHHVMDDSNNESDEPTEFTWRGIYRKFDVSDEGRNISWRETHIRPIFSNNSLLVATQIVKYAILSEDGTSFDLDHKTSSGFQAGVLGINPLCRWIALKDWSSINTITMRMSTDEPSTSFSDFAALRHWITTPLGDVLASLDKPDKEHRIILKFHLGSPSTLSMLRIKMSRFLQLTLKLNRHVQVVFALTHSAYGEENFESHTTTLEQLRYNFFVLLSKFCDIYDWGSDMACPDVEIDGRGMPVQLFHPEGTPQSGQPYLLVDPCTLRKDTMIYGSLCKDRRVPNAGRLRRHSEAPGYIKIRDMWLDLKEVIEYY